MLLSLLPVQVKQETSKQKFENSPDHAITLIQRCMTGRACRIAEVLLLSLLRYDQRKSGYSIRLLVWLSFSASTAMELV